jgi:hypothetical protein
MMLAQPPPQHLAQGLVRARYDRDGRRSSSDKVKGASEGNQVSSLNSSESVLA